MIVLILIIPLLAGSFISEHAEFFNTANKEIEAGATWHYVGRQPLDTTAKALSLRVSNGEPYIIYKLK
jgi:hypothetical protein